MIIMLWVNLFLIFIAIRQRQKCNELERYIEHYVSKAQEKTRESIEQYKNEISIDQLLKQTEYNSRKGE